MASSFARPRSAGPAAGLPPGPAGANLWWLPCAALGCGLALLFSPLDEPVAKALGEPLVAHLSAGGAAPVVPGVPVARDAGLGREALARNIKAPGPVPGSSAGGGETMGMGHSTPAANAGAMDPTVARRAQAPLRLPQPPPQPPG